MNRNTIDPVSAFNEFIREYKNKEGKYVYRELIQEMVENHQVSLNVDFYDLITFNSELARRTIDDPIEFLEAGNRAVSEVAEIEDSDYTFIERNFFMRFYNLLESETVPVYQIRSKHIGKLIMIKGKIQKISDVKSLIVEGFFQCQNCQEIMILPQEEGRYNPPHHCQNPECGRKGPFKLLSDDSTYIDMQDLTIQDPPVKDEQNTSRREIKTMITNDLTVNNLKKNDIVHIVGVPITTQESIKSARFELRLLANNIKRLYE